ncbi:MAG: hypothetical protein AB7P69_14070, partial [Candidatus Binatia bacterium]
AWTLPLATATTRLSRFAPWLLLMFIVTSSFWFGARFDMLEKPQIPPVSTAAEQDLPKGRQVSAAPSTPTAQLTNEKERSSGKAEFVPGQSSHPSMWPAITPLILMLVVVAWVAWRKQEEVVVKDSPEFVEALKIWLPVITAKQNTPRSVKRFLNRVRYLAMLQRPQEETARPIVVVQTNGKPAANGKIIPESLLVALSAVHQRYPERAETNDSFMEKVKELGGELAEQEVANLPPVLLRGVQIFNNAWTAHEEQFHNIEAADAYWSTFVEMSEGIRVQS